jgi:hypothetical protein
VNFIKTAFLAGNSFFINDLQMGFSIPIRVRSRDAVGVGMPPIATEPLSLAYRGCPLIF